MIKNYVFFCGLILSAAAGPTEYFPIKLGQAYIMGTDDPRDWNRVITSTKGIKVRRQIPFVPISSVGPGLR